MAIVLGAMAKARFYHGGHGGYRVSLREKLMNRRGAEIAGKIREREARLERVMHFWPYPPAPIPTSGERGDSEVPLHPVGRDLGRG